MKKIITLTIIIFLILGTYFLFKNKEKKIDILTTNNINESSFISMMVENEDGNYEEKNDKNFPNEDYIFNPIKSGCENGGTLSWNKEKEKIEASLLTSDKCYAFFDKYDFKKYCQYNQDDSLKCQIVKNQDNTLIYHDGKADFPEEKLFQLEAEDLSYRFSGGDYKISDKYSNYTHIFYDLIKYRCKDTDTDINSCSDPNSYFYLNYNLEVQYKIFKDAIAVAIKDGALIKDEVKNYLCFGSDLEPCPQENLYRIIGLYKNDEGKYEIKVIKNDYTTSQQSGGEGIGTFVEKYDYDYTLPYMGVMDINEGAIYNWGNSSNFWNESDLNLINLNKYYLNEYLGEGNNIDVNPNKWQQLIMKHNWKTIGFSDQYWTPTKQYYEYELGLKQEPNPVFPTNAEEFSAYIGLMYLSDYGYSASSDNWNKGLIYYTSNTNMDNNWLFIGYTDWTITRKTDLQQIAIVGLTGRSSRADIKSLAMIRPCFYLNSNVKYASGDGSFSNPYRIKI